MTKLPEKASYFEIKAELLLYIPIRTRVIWHEKWQAAYLENGNLTHNDLFRLGGLKTLRGFNEMQFFAKNYLLHTSELRLLTEKQSFLFIFSDAVFLENFAGKELAYGFGAGISLKMKGGIFNFVYAAGKSGEQAVGLRESKIHFGFVSRF
jgi:hemolysin activation/secretion protein